jgi:hypothetical protein
MITTKPINLGQLADECRAGGESGELFMTEQAGSHNIEQVMADGERNALSAAQQALVDAHVAMRCKTDAELAAEFQDPNTTAVRRQEIRDMQAGLLPCEQVPM